MNLSEALEQVKHFIQEVEGLPEIIPNPGKKTPGLWFSREHLGTLMLYDDSVDKYRTCLGNLFEAVAASEHLSLKAVEDSFQTAILQALDIEEKHTETPFEQRLTEAVEKLRQTLQAQPENWQLHFRVAGLAASCLPLTVGKVEFYTADKVRLSALSNKTNAVVDLSTSSAETKAVAKEYLAQELAKYLDGQTIACVGVKAVDAEAAHSLALRELRLTLDVINFYADLLQPRGAKSSVYLPGERERINDLSLSFGEGATPRYEFTFEAKGPLAPLNLASVLDVEKAGTNGYVRISQILASSRRNRLEERILSAFQWAGRATVDDRREEAFLLYAIALESLLLGTQHDVELGYRLRLKCAHILGANPEAKQRIAKRVAALYATRSKIVHAGNIQVTDAELNEIWFYTKGALVALLTQEQFVALKTEDELEQWFEARLMGA